jgi:hypothetical protein
MTHVRLAGRHSGVNWTVAHAPPPRGVASSSRGRSWPQGCRATAPRRRPNLSPQSPDRESRIVSRGRPGRPTPPARPPSPAPSPRELSDHITRAESKRVAKEYFDAAVPAQDIADSSPEASQITQGSIARHSPLDAYGPDSLRARRALDFLDTDVALSRQQHANQLRGFASHPTFGRHPELADVPLCGFDPLLGPGNPVLVVDQPEVQLRSGLWLRPEAVNPSLPCLAPGLVQS